MSEMKSAFEKAMEKAEKLGKLSAEEMRQRREDEYTPVGRAIVDRYLGHGHTTILEDEINRYRGDEKNVVTRAALSRLREAIGLENNEVVERAIAGMIVLTSDRRVGEIGERIRSLIREYREAKIAKYEQEKDHIERREREVLHQLRISGSAIGDINLEASEAWARISQELSSQFNERLEELKQQLPNSSGVS